MIDKKSVSFQIPSFYLLNVLYERICQVMPIAKTIKRVANHIFPAMKMNNTAKSAKLMKRR